MLESVYLTKSKVRSRLLGILFSKPDHKYYLSELARLAGASVGNAQRELGRFVKDELILREKKGSLVFYFLNTNHALFPEICSLVLKTVGVEKELQALVLQVKVIKLAFIYGSVARGQSKGESDIDLLAVSDEDLDEFYVSLKTLEKKFSREINPTVYNSAEFRKKIAAKDSFVTNILKKPYRLLKGDLREFE